MWEHYFWQSNEFNVKESQWSLRRNTPSTPNPSIGTRIPTTRVTRRRYCGEVLTWSNSFNHRVEEPSRRGASALSWVVSILLHNTCDKGPFICECDISLIRPKCDPPSLPPPHFIRQNWLFYQHIYTYCHKWASFMNVPIFILIESVVSS